MNNNKSHPGKGVDMKLIRKKIKKHIAEIDIENFHLNDHSKRELMFTAKAFQCAGVPASYAPVDNAERCSGQ
jgi:hypothetical protein